MKVEKNIFNIQKAWIPITRITKITQNLQETMGVDGAFRKREYCIRQSYKYLNEHAIRISISTNHTSDISDKYDKINDHMHKKSNRSIYQANMWWGKSLDECTINLTRKLSSPGGKLSAISKTLRQD